MSFKPKFQKGRILKQHMLEALRDYPYDLVHTLFADMGDGIISGLNISSPDEKHFEVSLGIVKMNGELYFLTQNITLEFQETRNYVYLKKSISETDDGTISEVSIIQKQSEDTSLFELFRYVKNATVKQYTDIGEVYCDTPNRIDQSFALKSVVGGSTLCNSYYILFADAILKRPNADVRDVSFAYHCLNGISHIELVKSYFGTESVSNSQVIQLMKNKLQMLEDLSQPAQVVTPSRQPEKKMIIS